MSEQDPGATSVVEDLVMAMLSVDSWTLEKSFEIREQLEREGFFALESLAERSPTDVFERLERAGYARGDFMICTMSDRLLHMADLLAGDGLPELLGLVESKGPELDTFLQQIKGVGPAVVRKFRTLRGI